MSAPVRPRPHRRARQQLLLGLVPLLVIGAAVLAVLLVRLSDARAPLAAATAVGRADVVASRQPPDGRGISVTIDAGGTTRTGVLVGAQPVSVAPGTTLTVQYDPRSPVGSTAVYTDGDAAHRTLENLLFGLVVVVAVLLAATLTTGVRLVTRPRLRRLPPTEVVASRLVVRRGLLVRSWLELVTPQGLRFLPVHWSPELAALAPGTPIEVRGDTGRGTLVLPVAAGAEIWPSGRLRRREPRGERRVAAADPGSAGTGWGRQVRGDVLPLVAAPLLGVLWAYVDGSGVGGFAVATLVVAGVLFWLTELLGSDPAPPERA